MSYGTRALFLFVLCLLSGYSKAARPAERGLVWLDAGSHQIREKARPPITGFGNLAFGAGLDMIDRAADKVMKSANPRGKVMCFAGKIGVGLVKKATSLIQNSSDPDVPTWEGLEEDYACPTQNQMIHVRSPEHLDQLVAENEGNIIHIKFVCQANGDKAIYVLFSLAPG